MSYIPSVNIEHGLPKDFRYIVTPNTETVFGSIIDGYNNGHHSFTIIGTYGTGKSSFLAAFQRDLVLGTKYIVKNTEVFPCKKFNFIDIVGDYQSLSSLIAQKIGLEPYASSTDVLNALNDYYNQKAHKGEFLIIIVDELGKVLEHAATNNPEQELYFMQKLAEFANVPDCKIILLTTLHQNFNTYAYKLNQTQKNEWTKVKGRFKEIIFVEPVEQLLALTVNQVDKDDCKSFNQENEQGLRELLEVAKRYKILTADYDYEIARKLYPLDPISSVCLTCSMQRYGQNERTLFSFLESKDRYSLFAFKSSANRTYNLAEVYDYIVYNFYSYLVEVNEDSMEWQAMRLAVERLESGYVSDEIIEDCLAIVKTIGLLNLFCRSARIDDTLLNTYGYLALNIKNPEYCIKQLVEKKIIRFASYKSQYILFEGTDIDIENELYKAAGVVPIPSLSVENLEQYVHIKAVLAQSVYYDKGTPRYFQYVVSNVPYTIEPQGDVDGIINLVFPQGDVINDVKQASNENRAIIYAVFKNMKEITRHLYEIHKLKYVLKNVVIDDRVAQREVTNLLQYEEEQLNYAINECIYNKEIVTWVYKTKEIEIFNYKALNQYLSYVCNDIYPNAPILRNELFNRHKVTSVISSARVNLLDAILANSDKQDLGFDANAFPPEKTIYFTLLQETGMHRQADDGTYYLGEPQNDNVRAIWDACCEFVAGSVEKPRKLSELISILKSAPYKLKQGVVEFWLPIFLYIKQQDFALYEDGKFILAVNKEVFEILQKHPGDFTIKAYDVAGVKVDFFNKYRQFFHQDGNIQIQGASLIGIAKPFFRYIRGLNDYAKTTYKFDYPFTARFRDLLLNATDPQKTFLEDLPAAFGYKDLNLEEFLEQYLTLIRQAIQELNNCYDNFIGRIEKAVVDHLGLPYDYEDYKPLLDARYRNINKEILTSKTRSFLDRLLAPSANRNEFYAKIGLVIFDKRVENIKDSEEALFISNMLHLFSELEHYTELSDAAISSSDEAYNIDFVSTTGANVSKKTFRLPESKKSAANAAAQKLSSYLTGDKEMDVCVLLKLLNEKINQ